MKVIIGSKEIRTTDAPVWVTASGSSGMVVSDCVNISMALEAVTSFFHPGRTSIMLPIRDLFDGTPPCQSFCRRGIEPIMTPLSEYRAGALRFSTLLQFPAATFSAIGVYDWDSGVIEVRSRIPGLPAHWSVVPEGQHEKGALLDALTLTCPAIFPGLATWAEELTTEKADFVDGILGQLGLGRGIHVSRIGSAGQYECWIGGEPVRSMRPDLRYSVMAVLISLAGNQAAPHRAYFPVLILEYPEIASAPDVVIKTALMCGNIRWIFVSRNDPPDWADEIQRVRW